MKDIARDVRLLVEANLKRNNNYIYIFIIVGLFAFLVCVIVSLHPYFNVANPPKYGDYKTRSKALGGDHPNAAGAINNFAIF